MKTAKKTADKAIVATTVGGEANTQAQEAVLTIVKDGEPHEAEQQQQGHGQPAQEQQPAPQEAVVKTLTVAEKLAAIKALDNIVIQRGKLVDMIDNLKGFVIQQTEAAELDEDDPYKTCQLSIRDDKGRSFSTKNTVLIAASVAHLLDKSEIKLEELETLLVFPAA